MTSPFPTEPTRSTSSAGWVPIALLPRIVVPAIMHIVASVFRLPPWTATAAATTFLGSAGARRGDIAQNREWMTRDCAEAFGAGRLTTAVMRRTGRAINIHTAPCRIRRRTSSRSMIVATAKAGTS